MSTEPLNDAELIDQAVLKLLVRANSVGARQPTKIAEKTIYHRDTVAATMTRLEEEGRLERFMGAQLTMDGYAYLNSLNERT